MGSEKGKKMLFSIDQLVILIAWLAATFAILYFNAYEMLVPSIAAFIILNLALGMCVNRNQQQAKGNYYRKYLITQTVFLVIWCPLLWLILLTSRTDLLPAWMIILVAFYIGLGVVSFRSVLGRKHRAGKNSRHEKKAGKKKKK